MIERDLISVIIPVYQVFPYLLKCVNSVIEQTYKNLEIILVDDGSTDGSNIICDQFVEFDRRIKVIHQKNDGLSAARNAGLDVLKGEYIAFIDGDDWVDENYIKFLYESCKSNGVDIAQCSYFEVIDEENISDTENNTLVLYSVEEFLISEFSVLSWRNNLTWNKLYKSKLFENIRFPKGKIHEDEFTTYRVVCRANKIAVNSKKLYYYRQRPDSIMGKKISNTVFDAGEALKEKIDFYKEKRLDELEILNRNKYLNWINERINLLYNKDETEKLLIHNLNEEKEEQEKIINTYKTKVWNFGYHGFIFPFNLVNKTEKIILYGAGDVGKQFYRQICHLNYCTIVLWLDLNAELKRHEGLNVLRLDEVDFETVAFEKIVVAINNPAIAKTIINMLVNIYNLNRETIIYQVVEF